jgi:hypothetical protein
MGGVLAAGVGVCGVSAAVAAAPVVKARSDEIAYTIGTILVFGVICMFLFPVVGHSLGMSYVQFGAWAGTGILNSAQVAGAALAFDPHGIETLKVAEIFNITRVLFLPIVVLWLATWYVKHEVGAEKVDLGKVLFAKFPVFVLGFILMFLLSTLGAFTPAGHYQGKYFSSAQIKEDKLLKGKETKAIEAELARLKEPAGAKALQDHFTEKSVNIGQRHATPERGRRQDEGTRCRHRQRDRQGQQGGLSQLEDHRCLPRLAGVVVLHRPDRPWHADHHGGAEAGGGHAADHRRRCRYGQGGRVADRGPAVHQGIRLGRQIMSEQKFERGTSLSIFVSDRREDLGSLVFALLIAIGIVLVVGQ